MKLNFSIALLSFFISTIGVFGQGTTVITAGTVINQVGEIFIVASRMNFNNDDAQALDSVFFVASGASSTTIGGAGSLSLKGIIIDKNAGSNQLDFGKNIAVSDSVVFVIGDLDINTFNLDLGDNGVVSGETQGNGFFGTTGTIIASNRAVPMGAANDFAGLGLTLHPVDAAITDVDIVRYVEAQTGNANNSILRAFDITTTPNTGLNIIMTMDYFPRERSATNGGTDEALFRFWKSPDAGATWEEEPSTANAGANYVSRAGIDALAERWTISSSVTRPLPINVLSFEGNCIDNKVNIRWMISKDDENYNLELQNSADGAQWVEIPSEAIQKVDSEGLIFEYKESSTNHKTYFRLWDPVENEPVEYQTVYCESGEDQILVYPLPANEEINISGIEGILKIQVWDLSGKIWAEKSIPQDNSSILINVKDWPEGIYIIKGILESGRIFSSKLVVTK
jgi:Secretion system C-terminal sorting domain